MIKQSLIFTLLILFFSVVANGQTTKKINWLSIEEAYNLNKKEPRKMFIDVYTNWCGWCKHMDKTTFADQQVAAYVNEHFYAIKLNAESVQPVNIMDIDMTPQKIARDMRVGSYPTIVFMEPDFKTINAVPGYRNAKQFLSVLQDFNK